MANLKVRLTPGAREDAVAGWRGDVLQVRVKAPPERGKANEALCRLIEEILAIRAIGTVNIWRGVTARNKLVRIAGLTDEEVRRKLGR
jgi:uncharacterized protein (TIGR00251 family)